MLFHSIILQTFTIVLFYGPVPAVGTARKDGMFTAEGERGRQQNKILQDH
jgi:hypothetical protein